jgi:putative DNA primase/helicase
MLDFNDTSPAGESGRRNVNDSERDEIRTELIARLESVLTTMFPAGKKRRGKFLIGDILGPTSTPTFPGCSTRLPI